jgi:Amt family ammonium transporter
MTGGFAAMVGAKILGPRLGRFENPAAFEGHSTPLVIIGTFLLWFGWYGFNPGSTLAITGGYGRDAARACVTTTLSAAAGGVTGLFVKRFLPTGMGGTHIWDIAHTCNSLLGGLVGITAGCACVTARDSIFIGMISAFFYHGASCMMRKLKIDDPLDAFAVHGACGVWGVWAVGFFGVNAYCSSVFAIDDAGLLFTGFKGKLLLTQLVVPLIEIAWVVTMSGIMFGILKVLKIFRVSPDEETAGMDVSKHGGDAYPESKSGM